MTAPHGTRLASFRFCEREHTACRRRRRNELRTDAIKISGREGNRPAMFQTPETHVESDHGDGLDLANCKRQAHNPGATLGRAGPGWRSCRGGVAIACAGLGELEPSKTRERKESR